MIEYIVKQWICVDPSQRGYWYECRRIKAKNHKEAVMKAFLNGKIPYGYKLEIA